MKIAVLDAKTLGNDMDYSIFDQFGEVEVYQNTAPYEVEERIKDVNVVIVNKIKLDRQNLFNAKKLRLICLMATGYDNIDLNYCWQREIGVCNVRGYSTNSVAQLTVSMALNLVTHLGEYAEHCRSGKYTAGGVANHLKPTFHEIAGMTWGVIGMGNIGRMVADIAGAMGCRVLASRRREEYPCISIEELCKNSDIISVHLPLNDETRGIISEKRIESMRDGAIFINVARGAVADEEALVRGIESGKLGGLGADVYSHEPFDSHHPYNRILNRPNVILTPHMGWAAYEARVRCFEEVCENIKAFFNGEIRNRVEI